MVYANGLIEEQRRIDGVESCRRCGGTVIWDEVHGWLHSDGWYACRQPGGGRPREVMAAPEWSA